MKYSRLEIKDLILCEPKVNNDNRGFVYESYKKETFDNFLGFEVNFCQDNNYQRFFSIKTNQCFKW